MHSERNEKRLWTEQLFETHYLNTSGISILFLVNKGTLDRPSTSRNCLSCSGWSFRVWWWWWLCWCRSPVTNIAEVAKRMNNENVNDLGFILKKFLSRSIMVTTAQRILIQFESSLRSKNICLKIHGSRSRCSFTYWSNKTLQTEFSFGRTTNTKQTVQDWKREIWNILF